MIISIILLLLLLFLTNDTPIYSFNRLILHFSFSLISPNTNSQLLTAMTGGSKNMVLISNFVAVVVVVNISY